MARAKQALRVVPSVVALDWTPERIAAFVGRLILLLPQGQGLVRAYWLCVCHCRDFAELRTTCEGLERIAQVDTSEHTQTLWRQLTIGLEQPKKREKRTP